MHSFNRRTLMAAIGASACAPALRDDLAGVLARHAEARGGAAALDAVRNTLNVAQVVEPSFTVVGRYIASTDGLMRVDIFYEDARAFSEGIDAAGAWNWPGDAAAPEPASTTASAALAHGVEFNLFGLHALPRRGHTLTLEGRRTIAGVDYYEVKLRLADGFETWRYINPQSWLVDRSRDRRALHPDVDPTEITIETEYADQRAVAGVLTPFSWVQRNVDTGQEMQHGAIQRLEYNVGVDTLNFPRDAALIRL